MRVVKSRSTAGAKHLMQPVRTASATHTRASACTQNVFAQTIDGERKQLTRPPLVENAGAAHVCIEQCSCHYSDNMTLPGSRSYTPRRALGATEKASSKAPSIQVKICRRATALAPLLNSLSIHNGVHICLPYKAKMLAISVRS